VVLGLGCEFEMWSAKFSGQIGNTIHTSQQTRWRYMESNPEYRNSPSHISVVGGQ